MGDEKQTRETDARISALAERQYGVVSGKQLEAMGVSRREIERRLTAARLHLLHRGVYAVGHRALSREAHWMAAVLACGTGAVLSHRSAAAHWGFRGYSGARIDVTAASKSRSKGAIRRHWAHLLPDELSEHERIPVTTVPRTIFDLANELTAQAVESALRQCEYLRLYDALSLWDLLERYPRHRGSKAIRTALASLGQTGGEPHSRLEERFLVFLDAQRLRRPNLNAWLEAGGQRYQVDCLWPDHKLIAELDSWKAHGTRSAFQSDKSRDRRLLRAGYRTTRVTRHQLEHEGDELAADLRALLHTTPTP